ncbi:MAG: hypothetical protein KC656_08215 [Myxococcales bacterium]|nr:hypothetical protein [Myxococcales bacterium]MCB9668162.1 hypothetical protein [Alphaproteobacteria bacterium]MCB9692501.1 hypothetical protein [Alphaproteobacteria bacterium]
MMTKTPLLLLLLAACGPNLEGSWSGTIECENTDVPSTLTVEPGSKGVYPATMDWDVDQQVEGKGLTIDIEFDLHFDLEITADGKGEQTLQIRSLGTEMECTVYVDGELFTDSCDEAGIDPTELEDEAGDFGEVTWDGADTITVADADCSGTLTR